MLFNLKCPFKYFLLKLLKQTGLSFDDISMFEVNEAFSIVALAYIKKFGLDATKVNVHGGAVALGHPLGLKY